MQRRHLWVFTILLGALTTLTTCSGCGAPTATGGLVFKVAAGVDRDDEALIREIARDARRYYEKQLGYGLQGQVVINLDLSDSLSKPAYAAKDVTLYLRNSSWLRMGAFEKQYLVAHELFHAFQFDMAGPNAFATLGWIVEGTADFAAHKYMEAKGELDYSAALDYHKSAMSTSRLGQFVVHDSEYSLAVIGADYLLRQRGLKALTAFFTALQGLPAFEWRPAFETNFGTSADIFIEDFERTHPRSPPAR